MEFNELIKIKLFPILKKYGFKISEEFKNIIRFESSVMDINIVFNDLEKTNFIEIGNKNEILLPLNDKVVRYFFDVKLPIEQVTPQEFVETLCLIFELPKGIKVLEGNIGSFRKFIEYESEEYTSELFQNQILEISLKAWENKDYAAFVENINKIDLNKIPQSYQLKYKIAKQKL